MNIRSPLKMNCIVRFWGWSENAREQAMDFAELSQRAKEGKPLYGQSDMSEYNQGVAYRNSAFSQLKFGECFCASGRSTVSQAHPADLSSRPAAFPWYVDLSVTGRAFPDYIVFIRFNLVSHPHHGTDPAKYQAAAEPSSSGAGKL
jgi:hypothetical protein